MALIGLLAAGVAHEINNPIGYVHSNLGTLQEYLGVLINAGQAIVGRGAIVLTSGVEDGEVWISISDSGSGIPEDAMQRIFDPFYTTKQIGHGTGLAICYTIVAKHHGRIEVSSRPGAGSAFRVVLPIVQPAVPAGAADASDGTVIAAAS